MQWDNCFIPEFYDSFFHPIGKKYPHKEGETKEFEKVQR